MSSKYNGLSLRGSYGLMLNELSSDTDFFVAACDTSTSAGLDRFKSKNENRYIEFGISEQAAMSAAAAFTLQNNKMFLSTFAPFVTYRCAEQIKVSVSYDKAPLCFVGLAAGLVQSHLGGTHCSFSENAFLKSLSNLEVYTPANQSELLLVLRSYLEKPKPMYIRLLGDSKLNRNQSEEISPFFYKQSEGKEVAIVFTGTLFHYESKLLEALDIYNLKPSTYSLTNLNQDNFENVIKELTEFSRVFFVEEHTVLGSIYSEIKLYGSKINSKFIGIDLNLVELGGSYEEALNSTKLDVIGITQQILSTI